METVPKDFQLTDIVIGSGGFASVKLMYSPSTGCIAVRKEFQKRGFQSSRLNEQKYLDREHQALQELEHPAISKFFQFGNTDKIAYIDMEYLIGGDYKSAVEEMNRAQQLIVLYGTAKAITYMHSKNYIHRDIKLENILLDDRLYPRLSDFGFARLKSNKAVTTVGTPVYIAPEYFTAKLTPKTDVYAFGIVIYATAYFSRFSRDGITEVLAPMAGAEEGMELVQRARCDYVNDDLWPLFASCCDVDPEKRPTMEEVAAEIKKLGDGDEDFDAYVKYLESDPKWEPRCRPENIKEFIKRGTGIYGIVRTVRFLQEEGKFLDVELPPEDEM